MDQGVHAVDHDVPLSDLTSRPRLHGPPISLADTIAKIYQKAGYATVAYSSVLFTGKFTNLQQGYEELHESTSVEDPQYHSKTARTYVDRAMNWMERHRDVPFFMYLHVLDPHDPFEPRAPYDSLWADPAKKEAHGKELTQIRKFMRTRCCKASVCLVAPKYKKRE